MRLPSWSELIAFEQQRDVLEVPFDHPLFVVGPPGSGKTVLAIHRARAMAEAYLSVRIITFHRMLRRHIQLLSPDVEPSTMHAFVGRHYRDRMGEEVPLQPASEYKYQWDTMCQRLDSLAALGTRINCVILDEAQDQEIGSFRYLIRIADTLNIFADTEQSVTSNYTSYQDIMDVTGIRHSIILADNHRNCPEVARVAEHYHDGILPMARVIRPRSGHIPRLRRAQTIKDASRLISTWLVARSGSVGVIVNKSEYGLKLQHAIQQSLPNRRVDRYATEESNEASIVLSEPGITILNYRSVKGQEFDSVFILQLDHFVPCRNPVDKRIMYMMCSRARDFLFLVHCNKALSPVAERSLPGPNLLERT